MPDAPETLRLAPGGAIPNHPDLPVLLYRGVLPKDAAAVERLFEANGWVGTWRNGIYDFNHYHVEGHEALGVVRGRARVLLGGPEGEAVTLEAGDLAVLPAGTGHCRLEASGDFLVVGAYPPGQRGDIVSDSATPEIRARIAALPLPGTDPVEGRGGSLTRLWTR